MTSLKKIVNKDLQTEHSHFTA